MLVTQTDLPDAAPPKADDAPGVAAAPKPGDPIWALLPNPPGVAGAPKTAPGVLGVPKAAPGDAGTPKPPPGDRNAFSGVAPVPNAGVGVAGFAKPAQNVVGEHADHFVLTSATCCDRKCKATVWIQMVTTNNIGNDITTMARCLSEAKYFRLIDV